MAYFVVSYDLVKRKDYPKLWDEFERLDAQKVLNSMYLLSADNTAKEIADHFAEFIDDDDRLMVIEFDEKPRYPRALKGTNDWVNSNF